jgi:hypothetical protein
MANRGPRVLQTLPADGLVAEEIIDSLREEYGYPATPQEYRLIVRIAPDEAERQSARRRREPAALAAVTEAPDEATEADDGSDVPREAAPTARRGRLRRRRRGRGRGGGAPGPDAGETPAGPGDPPQDPPDSGGGGEPGED